MGRRALGRSVKRIPPTPEAMKEYLHLWVQEELHEHPERFTPLTSEALFGNSRPLEMEVGCGTSEYLCGLAAERPEVNFLGIDPLTKVLFHAVRQADGMGLKNLRFVRSPMHVLNPLLVPESLSAVYVHFPDPYLRKHGLHKVLNPTFIEAVHRALRPDGLFSLVSDRPDLFEATLRLVDKHGGWERTHPERHLVGFEPSVKSRYQLKWERFNLAALRAELRKRAVAGASKPSDVPDTIAS